MVLPDHIAGISTKNGWNCQYNQRSLYATSTEDENLQKPKPIDGHL